MENYNGEAFTYVEELKESITSGNCYSCKTKQCTDRIPKFYLKLIAKQKNLDPEIEDLVSNNFEKLLA